MKLEKITDAELLNRMLDCISWIKESNDLSEKGIIEPITSNVSSVESMQRLQFLEYTMDITNEASRRWGYDFTEVKAEYDNLLQVMCRGNA